MKLIKAEKIAILITLVFVLAAALCMLLVPEGFTVSVTKSPALPLETAGASPSAEGTINLNTATAAELKTLPGIGDTLAERIIALRQELGGFSSIEDITGVYGIGAQTFSEIKAFITVN